MIGNKFVFVLLFRYISSALFILIIVLFTMYYSRIEVWDIDKL